MSYKESLRDQEDHEIQIRELGDEYDLATCNLTDEYTRERDMLDWRLKEDRLFLSQAYLKAVAAHEEAILRDFVAK